MRVLVQWARSSRPGDWSEYDSADWASLPNDPIAAVCVQGVVFHADRYAVLHGRASIEVWAETDGPQSGTRLRIVTFNDLCPDPLFGGAVNTKITQVVYTDDGSFTESDSTDVRPWDSRPASERAWRSGKLMPDRLWEAHRKELSPRGWREWTDGVDKALIVNGQVVQQRRRGMWLRARGTRTYYLNNVAVTSGIHNAADNELEIGLAPAGIFDLVSSSITGAGTLLYCAYSPVSEPNSAAWPTGTYRHQIDCKQVNSDIMYGVTQLGSSPKDGHFARVNAAIDTELESHMQDQGSFSFTGLKLASYTGSWTAGAVGDRCEVGLACERPNGHGDATITIEIGESDDFVDGPWAAAAVDAGGLFFGPGI